MRFYTTPHRYYCGIDLHARRMYSACSTPRARSWSTATGRPRPSTSSRRLPRTAKTGRGGGVHVRLVLGRRPLRPGGHSLRAGPRAVHEGHSRRQGQERPDRSAQDRRAPAWRDPAAGLRLSAGDARYPRSLAPALPFPAQAGRADHAHPEHGQPSTTCRPSARRSLSRQSHRARRTFRRPRASARASSPTWP